MFKVIRPVVNKKNTAILHCAIIRAHLLANALLDDMLSFITRTIHVIRSGGAINYFRHKERLALRSSGWAAPFIKILGVS